MIELLFIRHQDNKTQFEEPRQCRFFWHYLKEKAISFCIQS
jgi:hypothetical protein